MAASDWQIMLNSLAAASVPRGVTAGLTRPNGGGTHLYAFNSVDNAAIGSVCLRADQANFNPFTGNNGGQVTGAIQRKQGSAADMSTFLFLGAQSDDVTTAESYILGLAAGDPGAIVLRKGTLVGGLPDDVVGSSGILRKSTETVDLDSWTHLRLDVIVNPSGDVVLRCFKSDLSAQDVSNPIWEAIPGMDDYIDDALGVNSGSPGLTGGGRAGFGFFVSTSAVVGAVDHVQVARTTN